MIPDDIRKAAEKALDDIDGCGCDRCTNTVVIALMNERERAAKIVDRYNIGFADDDRERNAIIAAIRRGDNPDA